MTLHRLAMSPCYAIAMKELVAQQSAMRETAVIGALSTILSFLVVGGMYAAVFGIDDRFWDSMTIAIIAPWMISFPLAWYMANHRLRLVEMAERLREAREQLSDVNKQLVRKANYDGMTNLPNREWFFDRLDEVRKDRDNNILMIIDVDHFKHINDSFGHPIGDKALILLSNVFRKILRKDDLVGRIGGEEFGVFLPDTSEAEGQIIGEMIRHEVESTAFEPHQGVRHVITVSIGLTPAPTHFERPQMMRNADSALFEAKRRGRNRVLLFEPGMRAKPRPAYAQAQELAQLQESANIR